MSWSQASHAPGARWPPALPPTLRISTLSWSRCSFFAIVSQSVAATPVRQSKLILVDAAIAWSGAAGG
jgi:hypothetical protein